MKKYLIAILSAILILKLNAKAMDQEFSGGSSPFYKLFKYNEDYCNETNGVPAKSNETQNLPSFAKKHIKSMPGKNTQSENGYFEKKHYKRWSETELDKLKEILAEEYRLSNKPNWDRIASNFKERTKNQVQCIARYRELIKNKDKSGCTNSKQLNESK